MNEALNIQKSTEIRKLIRLDVYHGEMHGAPDYTVPVYEMPDGSEVVGYGEARDIRTGTVNGRTRALDITEVGEA